MVGNVGQTGVKMVYQIIFVFCYIIVNQLILIKLNILNIYILQFIDSDYIIIIILFLKNIWF